MEEKNPPSSEVLLYTSPAGKVKVELIFEGETFWLNQRKLAELFEVDVRTVSEHLVNIFKTGELEQAATVRKFRIVQREGQRDIARRWLMNGQTAAA